MLGNTATATSRQFSKRTTLHKYSENMASFAKARDELLVAYDEGTIDDEDFALLWEQNVSKNPSFPDKDYEELDLETIDPVEC